MRREGPRGGWLVGWLIDSSLVWAHTLLAPIIKDLLDRKKGKKKISPRRGTAGLHLENKKNLRMRVNLEG